MIICLIGYPWSGKSVVAENIRAHIQIHKVSTGDIVRSLIINDDDVDQFASNDLSITYNQHVIDRIREECDEHYNIVLDGFPRSREQCDVLKKIADESKNDVMIIWMWSNPLSILDRVNIANRQGRIDDNVDVVKGRIKACNGYKNVILEECVRNGWVMEQHTLDDGGRVADIIYAITRFALQ